MRSSLSLVRGEMEAQPGRHGEDAEDGGQPFSRCSIERVAARWRAAGGRVARARAGPQRDQRGLLLAAEPGTAQEHALISLLALNG